MKHVKAFTAEFKIEAVRSGKCTQTIRPLGKRPVQEKDTILFHGWEGRPYFSKWNWRMGVEVIKVINCEMFEDGVVLETPDYSEPDENDEYYFYDKDTPLPWDWLKELAILDGFNTWDDMWLYFTENYKLGFDVGKKFQIIRWKLSESYGNNEGGKD